MTESGLVLGKGRIRASVDKLSRGVPEKDRIWVSTEKWPNQGQYREKAIPCKCRKTVPTSIEKWSNLCEYRKMASSGSVPVKDRICASVEKLSRGVSQKVRFCESTQIWENQGEYQENVESVRMSKNCPGEYRKRVESM